MGAFRRTLFPLVAVLFACDEQPLAPCDREGACEVEGVDIAIQAVVPRWTADQPRRPGDSLHEVAPGDTIVVDVVVMNRGTVAATEDVLLRGWLLDGHMFLRLDTAIAPLGVGARQTVRLRFPVPEGPRFVRVPIGFPDSSEPRIEIYGAADADTTNDHAATFEFRAAAPLLELELTGIPDTLRTNRQYLGTLKVTNHSDWSFAGGFDMEWCAVYFEDARCMAGGMKAFSPFTLDAVQPNETRTFPVALELGIESIWWFDDPSPVAILPCVPIGPNYQCFAELSFRTPEDHYRTTVVPDLIAACDPPELTDGALWDVSTGLCEHDVEETFEIVKAVAWFASDAGACWRAEEAADVPLVTRLFREDMTGLNRDLDNDCWLVDEAGIHVLSLWAVGLGAIPSGTIAFTRVY